MENNITVIIPIHHLVKETKLSLEAAINSIKQQTVAPKDILLVVKQDRQIEEFCKTLVDESQILINKTSKTDYASQINLGVNNIKTEYFTVLELDDELNKTWISRATQYSKIYDKKVDIFLPIVYEYDKGTFVHMMNEAAWADSFSEIQGFYDLQMCLEVDVASLNGMVMKTTKFIELGGLKSNIKYYTNKEFLLRALNNSLKVFVIPKVGYLHSLNRKNSISAEMLTKDSKELTYWNNITKKEYYFKNDREIIDYNPSK